MGHGDLLLRLGTAALLGSLIGLERQRHDKSAGLRTHMLVSVGSALFMIVSAYGFDGVLRPERVVLDPSRVAAQVVSGIGFLGAGTILVRNQWVHGLTTAANIWAVAAIGLAAGGALYLAAFAATAIILVILAVIKPLEDRLLRRGHGERRSLRLVVTEPFAMDAIAARFRGAGLDIADLTVRDGENPGERRVEVTCSAAPIDAILKLVESLKAVEGVREVAVSVLG
jgi:putative Mg2+ transporter-C (MgtC) family protein